MQGSVREIALEIVRADGTRLPALVNSVLRDAAGEPQLVRTTVFDATDRKRYEHGAARGARPRAGARASGVERLQRITAALAAAPDAAAIAAAVLGELTTTFGARGAGPRRGDRTASCGVLAAPASCRRTRSPTATPGSTAARRTCATPARRSAARRRRAVPLARFAGPHAFAPESAPSCARAPSRPGSRSSARGSTSSSATSPTRSSRACSAARRPPIRATRSPPRYQPAVERPRGRRRLARRVRAAERAPRRSSSATSSGRGIARRQRDGPAAQRRARARRRRASSPAALLGHLDTFVEQIEPAQYATLAYADVDPDTGARRAAPRPATRPRCARAGRPPAFFMAGARRRSASRCPNAPRGQATFGLAPGERLPALHRRARRAPRASRSTRASRGSSTRSRRTRALRPGRSSTRCRTRSPSRRPRTTTSACSASGSRDEREHARRRADAPGSRSAPATSVAPVGGTSASPIRPSRCQSPAGRVMLWTGYAVAAPGSTPSVSIPIPATPRSTSSRAADGP